MEGADVLLFALCLLRDTLVALLLLVSMGIFIREGAVGLVRRASQLIRMIPGVNALVNLYLKREIKSFLKQLHLENEHGKTLSIPEKGLSNDELLAELQRRKEAEFDPDSGKAFAYVYTQEDSRFQAVQKAFDMFEFEVDTESGDKLDVIAGKKAVVEMFFHAFMHENALNPMVFPSLRTFETEVVAMVADMLGGGIGAVGSITSGGTESLLMTIKTYRDRARDLQPHISRPEVVAPVTIHPAVEKAASYFDVTIVHVPLKGNYEVDLAAYEKAINSNTILLLASAPEYCYGMLDPISAISAMAVKRNLPMHVDACFGGFMLPWLKKLEYDIPAFGFSLPGVTSMSADIHKYGLGPKGASTLIFRCPSIRRYQIFAYADWPGGLFGSPGMAGTRPGGNIASSWATLMSLGQNGYMDVAQQLMQVTEKMKNGINGIEGLVVCGRPCMTAFAFTSVDKSLSVYALADVMEAKGWKMERAQTSLHCTVLPSHTDEGVDKLLADLRDAVKIVKAHPELAQKGSAGVYGMATMIPDRDVVKDFVVEFFNEMFTLK